MSIPRFIMNENENSDKLHHVIQDKYGIISLHHHLISASVSDKERVNG